MRRACDAQTCPSLVHGSDTYVGGALASRTEGTLLSLVTKTTVYDCHGNPAYMFQTGGVFDTVINKVTYQSSFQMFALDGTQVAYVKGTTFAVDIISLYDMNEVLVATLNRDILSLSWVWKITVVVPGSPAADWRVLTAIAGYIAFNLNQSGNDICNSYFWDVAYAFLAVGCLLALLGACAARVWWQKRRGPGLSSSLMRSTAPQEPSVTTLNSLVLLT